MFLFQDFMCKTGFIEVESVFSNSHNGSMKIKSSSNVRAIHWGRSPLQTRTKEILMHCPKPFHLYFDSKCKFYPCSSFLMLFFSLSCYLYEGHAFTFDFLVSYSFLLYCYRKLSYSSVHISNHKYLHHIAPQQCNWKM